MCDTAWADATLGPALFRPEILHDEYTQTKKGLTWASTEQAGWAMTGATVARSARVEKSAATVLPSVRAWVCDSINYTEEVYIRIRIHFIH